LGGDVSDLRDGWETQLASDIDRDGMGLELLDPSDAVAAEIFRSDREKTVIVTTFNNDISVEIVDLYYREALSRLDPFEDGVPFSSVGVPGAPAR